MTFYEELNKNKCDALGKILIILSILILIFSIIILIKRPFLSVDEWYTKGIVKLSFCNIVQGVSSDVHPPLYYLILKVGMKIFSIIGLNFSIVYYIKAMSLVPYILITILSLTFIKKDYGYLTSGLFLFTTLTTSNLFKQYLTARMYSWSALFLVLTFICVKNIINRNDIKYWILLSIFSVLCAYTHYFAAIGAVVLYMLLFIYIIRNNKTEIKKWSLSVIVGIICYIPWLMILFDQLKSVHQSYWIPQVTFERIILFFSYALTSIKDQPFEIISFIIILSFIILIAKKYMEDKDNEKTYILFGILTFVGTILIGSIISLIFKPIIYERYLMPSIVVFWFAFSIFLGKGNLKKYSYIIVILLIVIGSVNLLYESQQIDSIYQSTQSNYKFIKSINNEDSIIIFEGLNKYLRLHDNFNNVSAKYTNYIVNDRIHNQSKYNFSDVEDNYFNLTPENIKNTEKNVYIVESTKENFKVDGLQIKLKEKVGPCGIFKVSIQS